MCFSSGNAAAQASAQQSQLIQQQADKRNADVAAGKGAIDTAFSQFDPKYFDEYKKSYIGKYEPDLENQFGIAKDKLYATLAGRGTESSTAGINKQAQLSKTFNDSQAGIADSAADATNQLRSNVDSTKSNLYGLNASAADPSAAATGAQAASGSIANPALAPNLSNVFAAALGPLAQANRTDRTSLYPQAPWNTLASGNGSANYRG